MAFTEAGRARRKERVLNWVNRQLAKLELELLDALPTGRRGVPNACVIARALRDGRRVPVDTSGSVSTIGRRPKLLKQGRFDPVHGWEPPEYAEDKRVEIKHPRFVQQFIRDFDSGKYPELQGR